MNSSGKEIIIKIENERVSFNQSFFLKITQTNIPRQYISFKSNLQIFWKVEMVELKEDCLKVKIIDYESNEIERFNTQNLKKPFSKLSFVNKFDWRKLEPLLYSYTIGKIGHLILNKGIPEKVPAPKKQITYLREPVERVFFQTKPVEIKPISRKITETFAIDFTKAEFKLGYVFFKKKINSVDDPIEFKIPNQHILAEFEYIKYWFIKVLRCKKFTVKATIELVDEKIHSTMATSSQIDSITPVLLDSIKYQRTLALIKEPKLNEIDKSLFTTSDIYSQFERETTKGNIFQQTDEDILSFLIEKAKVRNREMLGYLSKQIQSKNQPLRYTLHPNFGFLFSYIGEKNNHFIWELLNSNATYIWSISKGDEEFTLQLNRIENIINIIRANNRENYKRDYKNNHQDNDLVFRLIKHTDIGSGFKDGFIIWRNRLNEQLI